MIAQQTTPNQTGHSAIVEMSLRIGREDFRVSQVGGGVLVLDEPVELREHRGELTISIDGHVSKSTVTLEPEPGAQSHYRAAYH